MQVARIGDDMKAVYIITMGHKEATMLLQIVNSIGGEGKYRRMIVDALSNKLDTLGVESDPDLDVFAVGFPSLMDV